MSAIARATPTGIGLPKIPREISTEAAVTLWGAGVGAATFVGQLIAARRLSQIDAPRISVATIFMPVLLAGVGIALGSFLVPTEAITGGII